MKFTTPDTASISAARYAALDAYDAAVADARDVFASTAFAARFAAPDAAADAAARAAYDAVCAEALDAYDAAVAAEMSGSASTLAADSAAIAASTTGFRGEQKSTEQEKS